MRTFSTCRKRNRINVVYIARERKKWKRERKSGERKEEKIASAYEKSASMQNASEHKIDELRSVEWDIRDLTYRILSDAKCGKKNEKNQIWHKLMVCPCFWPFEHSRWRFFTSPTTIFIRLKEDLLVASNYRKIMSNQKSNSQKR